MKREVVEALKVLIDEEAGKILNDEELKVKVLPTSSRTDRVPTKSTRSLREEPSAARSRVRAGNAICCCSSKAQ